MRIVHPCHRWLKNKISYRILVSTISRSMTTPMGKQVHSNVGRFCYPISLECNCFVKINRLWNLRSVRVNVWPSVLVENGIGSRRTNNETRKCFIRSRLRRQIRMHQSGAFVLVSYFIFVQTRAILFIRVFFVHFSLHSDYFVSHFYLSFLLVSQFWRSE